jgi:hypothetical protein
MELTISVQKLVDAAAAVKGINEYSSKVPLVTRDLITNFIDTSKQLTTLLSTSAQIKSPDFSPEIFCVSFAHSLSVSILGRFAQQPPTG